MDVSKFLSKSIGIYLVIVSVAMLVNTQQFIAYVNGLINDAPLLFITGFFTLVLGIVMVVSHNIWQWNWRVIITIFSWIALLKGAIIILHPQLLSTIAFLFIQNIYIAYIAASIDLAIGALLCYFGFKRI